MCFWIFLNHFFCKFIKSIAVINICKRICARQYLKLFLCSFATNHTLVRTDRRRLIVRNIPMMIINNVAFLHPLLGVTSNFQFSSPIVNV